MSDKPKPTKEELARNLREALRRADERKEENEKAAASISKLTDVDDKQAALDVQTLRDAADDGDIPGIHTLLSILADDEAEKSRND